MNPWVSLFIGMFFGGLISGALIALIFVRNSKESNVSINKFKPKNSDVTRSFNEFGERKRKLFSRLFRKNK